MQFNIHHQFEDLQREEWNNLVNRSTTDVPFLYYGYLRGWWEHRGGGEWGDDAELMIITAREDDALVGIAPFFRVNFEGKDSLLLIGSIEISDYLDLILPEEQAGDFTAGLFAFLHEHAPEIENITLVNVPEGSPGLSAMQENARAAGWLADIQQAYHTPAIPLASDWDAYLAGIDKKQRHEIRRKLRGANQEADTVKWYTVSGEHDLDAEFEDFLDMMAQNPHKKEFLQGKMRSQMKATARWAFDVGILALSFLTIDGQKASAYFCFDYKDHIYVYNSGYDINFASFSPGWVHLAYLIQDAIANGRKYFDFMRGDETYKYRFGGEDSFVVKAIFTRE